MTSVGRNIASPNCASSGVPPMAVNPRLGPLQNNGGPTATHALLAGSPAIDAGDVGGCRGFDGGVLLTDQRGVERPFGPGCDLGAYEYDGCTYSVGSEHIVVKPDKAEDFQVAVAASAGRCGWTAVSSANWVIVTAARGTGNGTASYRVLPNPGAARRATVSVAGYSIPIAQGAHEGDRSDFDGDRRVDIAVYRPSSGAWYFLTSRSGHTAGEGYFWGGTGDIPLIGDYDGDGIADITVYRPSSGHWFILKSSTWFTKWDTYQWSSGVPVPGDYDGDGITDLAVYDSRTWSFNQSTTGFAWGRGYTWWMDPGDVPVAADFDGDGRTDLTLYRPATGYWFIRSSTHDFQDEKKYQWGTSGDVPVPGDYDGDGLADIAIFRPSAGMWYLLLSDGGFTRGAGYQWGAWEDVPVPGDYDGDGVTDIAVYRPSTTVWYVLESHSHFTTMKTFQWGAPGDVPLLRAR